MEWLKVSKYPVRPYMVVFLWNREDLYPVVGWTDGRDWFLEEAGPEDGEHRKRPTIGPSGWRPTHWSPMVQGLGP